MYSLMNTHLNSILASINQKKDVDEYDWLTHNLHAVQTQMYQDRYTRYWKLNRARLSHKYLSTYFNQLQIACGNPSPLASILGILYLVPVHVNGQKCLEFSFATKLLHMSNQREPIYDSLIGDFYYYTLPDSQMTLKARINDFTTFHKFLQKEYARLISLGVLSNAINVFRATFHPQYFTDEKILDSLIWSFVRLLKKGGLLTSTIVYS